MSVPTLGQWGKWFKMLQGKSPQHAPQGKGRSYSRSELRGYYNDLTEKYLGKAGSQLLDAQGIPIHLLASGEQIYFPTAVAQYGLGAYDVYLQENRPEAHETFLRCARWLREDMDEAGGWQMWSRLGIAGCPYSAMTQGEGASLLYRAWSDTGDQGFRRAGDRAIELMLRPVTEGGTACWSGDKVVLEEIPTEPSKAILNGWIFAIFGLYDAVLVGEYQKWQAVLKKTCAALAIDLHYYDTGFWSLYDRADHLASPFYHDLHINLLRVLAELTDQEIFMETAERWDQYRANKLYYARAFVTKACQKLRDPGEVVIVK